MRINIYYGGRGILGDPSSYAVKIMQKVFEELNVHVVRYDLYDSKINITTLPQSLKEADGVILAGTVEWHGIGGNLTSFLDACWLYGDKDKIAKIYMAPVVMSTTYGEKEAELDLITAWETLGGPTCHGISGYVPDAMELERSTDYQKVIEKTAENIYRAISQKAVSLPISSKVVSREVYKTKSSFLTQKETEQFSEYISDDQFVKKQKEDILELATQFKGKMNGKKKEDSNEIMGAFRSHFKPIPEVYFTCKLVLNSPAKTLALRVDNKNISIQEGDLAKPDLTLTMDHTVLEQIVSGEKSFHVSFMSGNLSALGELKYVRMLDELFPFS